VERIFQIYLAGEVGRYLNGQRMLAPLALFSIRSSWRRDATMIGAQVKATTNLRLDGSPHIAQNTSNRTSGIHARTTRRPGMRSASTSASAPRSLRLANQLHHFIAAGVWGAAPVETELLVEADRLVGGRDDTAILKEGVHSAGVAAQYASAVGKPPAAGPWYR
jgi:DDE superfamily endonuclease